MSKRLQQAVLLNSTKVKFTRQVVKLKNWSWQNKGSALSCRWPDNRLKTKEDQLDSKQWPSWWLVCIMFASFFHSYITRPQVLELVWFWLHQISAAKEFKVSLLQTTFDWTHFKMTRQQFVPPYYSFSVMCSVVHKLKKFLKAFHISQEVTFFLNEVHFHHYHKAIYTDTCTWGVI